MRSALSLAAVPLVLTAGLAAPEVAAQPVPVAAARPGPGGPPAPQGWTMAIGVATLAGTAWPGSRDMALAVLPDLRIAYRDRLFASVPEGLGWNAVNTRTWKAGPLIKPRFGRNADDGGSPFQVLGGSTALRGMGDIALAGEAGLFVERRFGRMAAWRARAELRQGFGGHQGLVGDVALTRTGRTGRVLYAVGPRATLASRDFVQTYYGVDPGQAARTGLAVSRPGGGLVSWGLGATAIRPLDRTRTVTLFGGIDRLGDGPARSALIRERGQRTTFSLGLAYSWRFRL